MKCVLKVIVILSICTTMACCSTYPDSRSCAEKYPNAYNPYTPGEYTISWTDFNPLFDVQRYFLYHDSTVCRHDGDTIMLYGYVTNNCAHAPRAGDSGFYLTNNKNGGYDENCFRMIVIGTPNGEPIPDWIIPYSTNVGWPIPARKVYVKGVIEAKVSYPIFMTIRAIHFDSVKF